MFSTAVLCASVAGAPREAPVHVVIPLRNVPGAVVTGAFASLTGPGGGDQRGLRVVGLDYCAVDVARSAVLAVGTPHAITELRKIVQLVDIAPPQIGISCRIIRSARDTDGRMRRTVESEPKITTLNNMEASVSVGSGRGTLTAVVTPRLNGDDTLTLAGELRLHRGPRIGGGGVYCRATRRAPQGSEQLLAWVPDFENEDTGPFRLTGVYLESPEKSAGLFLIVSARVVTPGH
jgi:hypothetical protein